MGKKNIVTTVEEKRAKKVLREVAFVKLVTAFPQVTFFIHVFASMAGWYVLLHSSPLIKSGC